MRNKFILLWLIIERLPVSPFRGWSILFSFRYTRKVSFHKYVSPNFVFLPSFILIFITHINRDVIKETLVLPLTDSNLFVYWLCINSSDRKLEIKIVSRIIIVIPLISLLGIIVLEWRTCSLGLFTNRLRNGVRSQTLI